MGARSLLFDLYGDYLRYRGGEVRMRVLVAVMECLGVPEPTTRVAVSRMRREGWLEATRQGRETSYSLTASARAMLDEGRTRIFTRATRPWDGQWRMVIYQVPETERALREQFRRRLAWLGFGPLAPSVWVSPHDRLAQVRAEFAAYPVARLDTFTARSEGTEADAGITTRAWDLPALDRDYQAFLAAHVPSPEGLPAGRAGDQAALAARMRLIHDYRRFPFRDPDLPADLLPAGWHGGKAHEMFLREHALLGPAAERAVDALAASAAGAA